MNLIGKGFYIWQIPNCENGDVEIIASMAKAAQLSHVLIKIADTTYSYNIYNGVDRVPALVQAMRARNIGVWGWQYVKGYDPIGEANKAIERVRSLQLDGYVIDAEIEYKEPGKSTAATRFMNQLRHSLPNTPIALSSYRYPSYHPQLPWRQFLDQCNYNMPQVYWEQAHNAGDQLMRSVREFQAMIPNRPIIPTGSAYVKSPWKPTAADVLQFLQTAQSLNLSATNFWSWDNCRENLPEVWNVIRDYPWTTDPTTSDICNRFIDALNSHNPDNVINLYTPTAVHVTAIRTVQGTDAIRTWYQSLLSQILPNATFRLSGFSGTGSSRHITWTATSPQGDVDDGNDTFGLVNGKIAYHYSFFMVA
jgi:hypothetical protein